jgi:hypothetical protein
MMRTVIATRYVTPLREGGSLPGLVEADDDGLYVVKFRGAGQGPRALVAEWLAGELARSIGLPVPDLVGIDIDPSLGDAEPDEEIHDLVNASGGRNLGMVTNPDRTAQNPNLLVWHGRPWLIDHGAALYIHHTWRDPDEHARRPFDRIASHVLLPFAGSIAAADERNAGRIDDALLIALTDAIPDTWLPDDAAAGDAAAQRRAYVRYLRLRLDAPRAFVTEADRVRPAA